MKSFRVLALSILALFAIVLTACGGGGSSPKPPAAPLKITTSLFPQATVNVPYVYLLQASGGTGIYTWAITKGSLPKGLSFTDAQGQISGTATQAGSFPMTFQVTDGAGTVASADLTLTVEGVVIISCSSCTGSSLPYGNPNVPYSATLSASGGTAPYTWCAVEADGTCDSGSGGALPPGLTITTVNNQGVISGTPTIPGTPATITVQASDSETPISRASRTLTLTIFDVGPKSLPNATIDTMYDQNASAIGGVGPFTWTLTGNLPPGLSLGSCVHSQRPTCLISGAPTQTGISNFSLTVADGETPPAMATVNLSITVGPLVTNTTLKGTYAIILNGFKSGNPYIMAGSLLADGNGNVTGGKLDYNDGTGEHYDPTQCRGAQICPIPQTIQTGSTYDLTAGNGTGTITLKTLDYQQNPYTYNFNIAVSGNGSSCQAARADSSCGRLIESSPQEYGSGVLKVQDPAIFGSFFPGNFGLLVNGTDPAGHRYAAVGALGTNPQTGVDIDCNTNGWGLGGCPLDTNDNGNNGAGATLPDPYGGTFASDVDQTTGRGNFVSLAFNSDPQSLCLGSLGGHYNCGYAYYIINFEEMYMISTDPTTSSGNPYANLTLWSALRQRSNSGWNVSNISANNIMELSANDGGKADVTAGLMTTDHAGNGAFTSDENDGGTLSQQTAAPGTIAVGTVGAKTGQFLFNGFPQFGTGGAVMYIWSGPNNNGGFFVGTDVKVTSGVMETQLPPPPGQVFSNASVNGSYVGATVTPVLSTVTNSVTFMFADGVGNMTASQVTSGSGGNNGPNNLALTYQVDPTGRGVVNQNQSPFGYLYVIGPEKFAMVPTGNAPALNVFATGQPD
jgi:hypothetical protein